MNLDILDKNIIVCSKRNAGKSVLIKYLIECYLDKFEKIFIICPTEKINNHYSSITTPDCIHDEFQEEWVELLIKKLSKINANKPKNEMKRALVVLDDVSLDANFHQSKSLRKMVGRGRHCGLTLISTAQSLTLLSPLQRQNADYCLCSQMSAGGLAVLDAEYRTKMNKKDFMDLYERSTLDYNFLVISNNSTKSADLNEIYGIIRTPESYKPTFSVKEKGGNS
jgi:hypothetical protein